MQFSAANSTSSQLSLRARAAICAGRSAAQISRRLGRGAGGVIGGRVASFIDSDITQKISRSMQVALVTGTNGKSTTTKMLNFALRATAPTAYNDHGDNMESGVSAALLENPQAPFAALEIDEMHLGIVADMVHPAVFVLLNLTRDQLDRVGSPAHVQQRIAQSIARYPQATVIANCDDPLIAAAVWNHPSVVWVAAGAQWEADSQDFPLGGKVERCGAQWQVGDKYRRPEPEWWVEEESLLHRQQDGTVQRYPLQLRLPGEYNRGNAAQAIAAAAVLGVAPEISLPEIAKITSVAGRYGRYQWEEKNIRMLLAKNPAGWQETLRTVEKAQALLLAVNAQVPDGEDASWLRDIDFGVLPEKIGGMPVYISGEAVVELQECLEKVGITPQVVESPAAALTALPMGKIEVVANYTAFRDIKNILDRSGASVLEA